MRRIPVCRTLSAIGLMCLPTACNTPDPAVHQLEQRIDELQVENGALEQRLLERDSAIAQLEGQVENLQSLPADVRNRLFTVDRVTFASLTGGADYDGVPGDDGVTVYLQPLDADGHVIKAAGRITIELIDTAEPGRPKSLGTFVHEAFPEIRKLWHSGMWTNHYTVRCPWDGRAGRPQSHEVTVKASFDDYLTGRRLTHTRAVSVELAGGPGT